MEKTLTYKTIKGLVKALDKDVLTLADMLSERAYHPKHGWINFKLAESARAEFFKGITSVIWAKPTPERVERVASAIPCGLYGRLWYDVRYDKYEYCAGQDYTGEIRYIQRTI